MKNVPFGVPQGSVLGPTLFIIFINNIGKGLKHSKVKLYADDLVLYTSDKCPVTARNRLQEDCDTLVGNYKDVGLTVNIAKTKCVWYASRQKFKQCPRLDIVLKGQKIQQVNSYLYLGTCLDRYLTMEEQANIVRNKANQHAFKLGKIRYLVGAEVAISIFKQTILPRLDYCSFLLDIANKNVLGKLQTVQNRMLRCCILAQTRDETSDVVHTLCETPKQEVRRREILLSAMFSKSKKLPPLAAEPRTRNDFKRNFPLIKPKLESYKKGPFYRGAQLWNGLDQDQQFTIDKLSFKTKIKKRLGTAMKGRRTQLLTARRKQGNKGPTGPNLYYDVFPPKRVKKKPQTSTSTLT